jgi:predicted transcriptional regulator of viral defense system
MLNYDKLMALAKANNGIILAKRVVEAKIAKDYLSHAVKDGVLEKVARGVYVLKGTLVDDYYLLQLKRSKAVFSHTTSAYLNHLTTRDPIVLSLTVPTEYNVSDLITAGHKVYFMHRTKYAIGIIESKTMLGNKIKIYDAERTVCDLFSARYAGDPYIALESLKSYLQSSEKDLHKLMDYAKQLGVEKTLREKIEVMSI